jgi:hypothetical protein
MAELFTRRDEGVLRTCTLGVNNPMHFNPDGRHSGVQWNLPRSVVAEHMRRRNEFSCDDIFRHLVVQRSRAYALPLKARCATQQELQCSRS